MKKFLLLSVTFCLLSVANCQLQYWQQNVNYKIQVTLNDRNHSLKGSVTIEYTNNSPDQLDFIWFHLWPNAYKDENTPYAKQVFRDEDGKKRWKGMKDKGYIDSLDFYVNGKKAATEKNEKAIDILKLLLPEKLQPGEKITITTPFFVKIPSYASRSGHIDQSYIICQWYPKPAVYDKKGWHPISYLDQGEFYSEFGNFDVSITVPAAYVIGATGALQNTDELNSYKELGKRNNYADHNLAKYSPVSVAEKTLQYKCENIHDFAWFADKEFIVRYDTAQLASGKIIDVFSYGYEKGNKNWSKSVSYVEDAIRHYSNWIGEYPFSIAQAVEGPQNVSSGGMEYPTITLITSPDADEPKLDGVIAHEVGHNWFYSMLGSNERDHPWMDEGMNTFFQFRYEAEKYRANSIFGNLIPQELKTKSLPDFLGAVYNSMSQIPMDEAIETASEDFRDKEKYGIVIYLKTAIWMYIVELSVGSEKMEKVMKAYFNDWKFKHPYPEDLKAEFEKELSMKFDDIFSLLNKKGKFD